MSTTPTAPTPAWAVILQAADGAIQALLGEVAPEASAVITALSGIAQAAIQAYEAASGQAVTVADLQALLADVPLQTPPAAGGTV